jgi:hypothetical protein
LFCSFSLFSPALRPNIPDSRWKDWDAPLSDDDFAPSSSKKSTWKGKGKAPTVKAKMCPRPKKTTCKTVVLTEDEGEPEAIGIQSDSDDEDRSVLGGSCARLLVQLLNKRSCRTFRL